MNKLLLILFVLITLGCGEENYYTSNETELKLNIVPFETNKSEYDYVNSDSVFDLTIYIGKVNQNYLNEVENENDYYIQLNNVLTTSSEDINNFVDPTHRDAENYRIKIIADKNTFPALLQEIEYRIAYYGFYNKKQIYYLEENLKEGTQGFNHQPSRIEQTKTANFDTKEYMQFIKHLVLDSLNCNWLYYLPVHIIKDVPIESFSNNKSDFIFVPPPPPSILYYKFDSLTFNSNTFESIKIISDSDFFNFKKGMNTDSLFNIYGKGIVVSLPYIQKGVNESLVDYEIIDWSWCGTGKYQTIPYRKQ